MLILSNYAANLQCYFFPFFFWCLPLEETWSKLQYILEILLFKHLEITALFILPKTNFLVFNSIVLKRYYSLGFLQPPHHLPPPRLKSLCKLILSYRLCMSGAGRRIYIFKGFVLTLINSQDEEVLVEIEGIFRVPRGPTSMKQQLPRLEQHMLQAQANATLTIVSSAILNMKCSFFNRGVFHSILVGTQRVS